jgi:3-oxoacyl-[acyl-carrier protein] reductase
VTGASSGIGQAVARSCSPGARGSRSPPAIGRLEAAARDLEAATGTASFAAAADVSDPARAGALVETPSAASAPCILVVNTGGPPAAGSPIDDLAWSSLRLLLMSAVTLARPRSRPCRAQRFGRIVFRLAHGKAARPGLILSNSLRAAVTGLAKTLSREVAAEGITVNSVCPGYTATARLDELALARARREAVSPEAIRARWLAGIPAGRLGRPEEIGDLVAFLASERAGYITGAAIPVDGGAIRSLL